MPSTIQAYILPMMLQARAAQKPVSYVSQLQANGVDIDTIKSLVGHADIQMTEHYLHVQSEVKGRAVQQLNSLFVFSAVCMACPETPVNQGVLSNNSIA